MQISDGNLCCHKTGNLSIMKRTILSAIIPNLTVVKKDNAVG